MDFSTRDSEKAATTYYCYLEGSKKLILDISGSDGEKMLGAIRMFAPRKVFAD